MIRKILLCLILFISVAIAADHKMDGIATWYGTGQFLGNRTPSGIICDGVTAQAAHKTLPFGTVVRVTEINSIYDEEPLYRSVVVVITDRGPYVKGRVLDLNAKWTINRLCGKPCGMATVVIEVVDDTYACKKYRCLSKVFGKRLEKHEIELLGLTQRK